MSYLLGLGVGLGSLNLQATVLGIPTLSFSVEDGHSQDLTFAFGSLIDASLLGEYQVVVQKRDPETGKWTTIDGSAEGASILDIGVLDGGQFGVEQALEPGQYRAFLTYEGVGVSALSSLSVSGTDFDHTHIGDISVTEVSGNVLENDGNAAAEGDLVTSVSVNGVDTPVEAGPDGTTVTGDYGELVIHQDGSYTYTPNADASVIGQVDQFTYTVHDPDTNVDNQATLYIRIDSNGQGLVWSEDPTQPATIGMAAGNDVDSGSIDTAYVVSDEMRDDVATASWTIFDLGQTKTATYTFTIDANEQADVAIGIASSELIGLGGTSGLVLEKSDGAGGWIIVEQASGSGLIDALGLLPDHRGFTVTGLTEGEYRLTVSQTVGLAVAGSLSADLAIETTHLDQVVVSNVVNASGNVLEDDILGSSFTKLQVTSDGINFVDASETGTQIVGNHGTLTIYANGDYTYEPNSDLSGIGGTDEFTYRLEHPNGTTVDTTLTIDVQHGIGPEAPVAGLEMARFTNGSDYDDVSLAAVETVDDQTADSGGEHAHLPLLGDLIRSDAEPHATTVDGLLDGLAGEDGDADGSSDSLFPNLFNTAVENASDTSGSEVGTALPEPMPDILNFIVLTPQEEDRNDNVI